MWEPVLYRTSRLFCSQLLVMQISSTPLHICLPAASSLLCGSDEGLLYFNTQLSSGNAKR